MYIYIIYVLHTMLYIWKNSYNICTYISYMYCTLYYTYGKIYIMYVHLYHIYIAHYYTYEKTYTCITPCVIYVHFTSSASAQSHTIICQQRPTHTYILYNIYTLHISHPHVISSKGWRRPLQCLISQVSLRISSSNQRALLQTMTYQGQASCGSMPACMCVSVTFIRENVQIW